MDARRAALLLHTLPVATRQRVMAKLDEVEAKRLKPLLKELAQLGVPRALGEQLQQLTSPAPSGSALPARALAAPQRLESLSGADVVRALNTCAAVTAGHLLRARQWPWQQDVLDRSSELRRAELLRHIRSDYPALAPAVLTLLCERVCLEVERASAEQQPANHPTVPAHVRLKKWMR